MNPNFDLLTGPKQELISQISNVNPFNSTEREHQKFMLDFLESNDVLFSRANLFGHFTASAWITNKSQDQVLMIHHKKLNRWLQPGGHIEDSDQRFYDAALREALEETGIKNIEPASNQIFDLDVHKIPERKEIPAHYHLDVRFHFYGDPLEVLQPNEEVSNIQWVPIESLIAEKPESSIFRMIEKLN